MSLKKIHRTRDGKELPIASMDDTHLVNMLNIVYQKVMIIKNSRSAGDPFKARLYGMRKIDDEQAADMISEALQELAPYFIEAYLRNLPEPRAMLMAIYDRDKRLEGFDDMPALISGNVIDFDSDLEDRDPDEGDR